VRRVRLVKRPDLNGRLSTLVCFHNDVRRWQLQIDGVTEVVRARASNLRRDRIEVVPGEGASFCVMRSKWFNPQDADASATRILVQHVTVQRTKTFEGSIIVHMDGQAARTVKLPAVTVLPSSVKLWDADELMRAVGAVLPLNVNVQQAHVLWDDPSEEDFCLSILSYLPASRRSHGAHLLLKEFSRSLRLKSRGRCMRDDHMLPALKAKVHTQGPSAHFSAPYTFASVRSTYFERQSVIVF
jgi:hypothetical protein